MHSVKDVDWFGMSPDELFLAVGDLVLAGSLGHSELPHEERREIGHSVLLGICREYRRALCEHRDLREVLGQHAGRDTVTLVALVGDVVSSALGVIPVAALATFLVHYSYDRLCGCGETP